MKIISLCIEAPKWPDGKTKLFVSCDKNAEVALLTEDFKDWNTYARAYKEAADLLFEKWKTNAFRCDQLAFPMVFLYRHQVELRLKGLLSQFDPDSVCLTNNKKPNHKIEEYWNAL